jgi:hypothetical protein
MDHEILESICTRGRTHSGGRGRAETAIVELAAHESKQSTSSVGMRVSPPPPVIVSFTSASGLAPPSSLSGEGGISKVSFLRFYQLVHKCLSGDDVDLTFSALHDWDRMVGGRTQPMSSMEFGNILFEQIDLWCLTHIPEDFVVILKALYCRMTRRTNVKSSAAGVGATQGTEWITEDMVGFTSECSVRPIINPARGANGKRDSQLKAARRRREQQASYKLVSASQAPIEDDDDDEGPSRFDSDHEFDSQDEEELEAEQDDDDDEVFNAKNVPLTDENGKLLSLNSREAQNYGNRLRAREQECKRGGRGMEERSRIAV